MISADVYLQPEAPDPVLEPAFVLELCRRHQPSVSAVVQVDESGGEARSYLIDGDLVLKTQRPHRLRPRTSLSKETLILEELARVSDLPVPKVLGYGTEGPVEYILMTRMPGIAMRHADLSSAAKVAALHQLGKVLRQLHEVRQDGFARSDLIPGDAEVGDLRTRITGIFERLDAAAQKVDGWPADLAPRAIGERLASDIPDEVPLVVLHSNPGPEHTYVDSKSGLFTGIIDFGDSYRSHPALDLRSWREPSAAKALVEGYLSGGGPPAGFETVRRTGLVMMEIAAAVNGRKEVRAAAETVRDLVT